MVRDAQNRCRGAKIWPHCPMVLKSPLPKINAIAEQVMPVAEPVTSPETTTTAKPTLHAHLARPPRQG